MIDEEWLACDSPARMRGEIRPRPFPGARWVLFDLACVQRGYGDLKEIPSEVINQ